MTNHRLLLAAVGVVALAAAGCSSSSKSSSPTSALPTSGAAGSGATNEASAPGVTPTGITIGLITDETGAASANWTGIIPSIEARFDEQNANGGVDGRKLTLEVKDDQSTPAGNGAASSAFAAGGVFGVIDEGDVAFGGYKALQSAGVPVTGGGYDGSEWDEQPNTNMFSIMGPEDPKDPQYTTLAEFAKTQGGKNCGSIGYQISACPLRDRPADSISPVRHWASRRHTSITPFRWG